MKGIAVITGVGGLVIGIVIGAYLLAPAEAPQPGEVAEEAATSDDAAPEAAGTGGSVRWRMGAAFPSSLAILGESGVRFVDRIAHLSEGEIEIRYFEPGALVPALELFDAVSAGSVDASWATAGYWAGKIPAAQFFTTVPFGPELPEFVAWLYHGGGLELWRDLYRPHDVHPVPCFMNAAEGSGWFREPIESLEDLQGLKMRFFGLGARVMEKLGVSTQLLAGGDIYPALELGTIDATEFSMPVIDEDLGFHQIAQYYYFPGWHQPDSIGEFAVNMDRWNALSDVQQDLIETVCRENILASMANAQASQFGPLQRLQEAGVELRRWPDSFLDAYRDAWHEVREEEAAKDPDFKRVLDSLASFRDDYKIWRELSRVTE